ASSTSSSPWSMYRYTEVYGGPAARIRSAASRSSSTRPTSRANAPRRAATTRSASSTGTSASPLAEHGLKGGGLVAAPHDDAHGISRVMVPERLGHRLQVGDAGLADPGDDVVAPEASLFRRTACPHAQQPHPARIVGHVRHRAEVRAVARHGRACG